MALGHKNGSVSSVAAATKFRRGVASSWQQERRQWHKVNDHKEVAATRRSDDCGGGTVSSLSSSSVVAPPATDRPVLCVLRSTHKMAFSHRQRLRKAGELLEPQLNSFDLSPPKPHTVKPNVTFSNRQRLRKRGLLNKKTTSSVEDEVFDFVEQLFPGARADYPPSSSSNNSNGDSSGSMEDAAMADDDGLRHTTNAAAAAAVPEFPVADDAENNNGSEQDSEETIAMGEREQAAQERRRKLGFKLKLGPNGRRLLSGAIAGAFSRTAVAPLETIRTHLMVGSHGHSLPEIFHWIITNEGWPGLFRGNAINVIRVAPSKAIELFAYDFVKAYLSPKDGTPGKLAFLPVSPIAGSCAGISSTMCMYPLELLKTRLTIQPGEYRGILHALWRIVSEEGVLELYRGLAPSVIGVIPYAGVNYFVYDSLRSLYKRCSKTDRVGNIQTLLIGSLAGAIASTSTFPLEVARKHMQVRISTLTPSSTIRLYYSLNKSCVSHQSHQSFFIT
jgi:hypothetical protein